jgi:hypothetical protein
VLTVPSFLWDVVADEIGRKCTNCLLHVLVVQTNEYINTMGLKGWAAQHVRELVTPLLQLVWFGWREWRNRHIMSIVGFNAANDNESEEDNYRENDHENNEDEEWFKTESMAVMDRLEKTALIEMCLQIGDL